MYLVIAAITFLFILNLPWKGASDLGGSAILALIWPVMIPAGAYFTVKKFVFKRHGPSEKFWELECLGILTVTALMLIVLKFPQLFVL